MLPERDPKNKKNFYLERLKKRFNSEDPFSSLLDIVAELYAEISELKIRHHIQRLEKPLIPLIERRYQGVRTLTISAGYHLSPEQGFHQIEYDREGNPYRWTGPGEVFFFDLHCDRSVPLKFKLTIIPKSGDQDIRAFCDEVEIPLIVSKSGSKRLYFGYLFPRAVLGLTRLYFRVNKVYPAEPPDKRVLGVIFLKLSIEEVSEEELKELSPSPMECTE